MLKWCTVNFEYSLGLPPDSIAVSADVRKKMNLSPGRQITLWVGNRRVSVRFLGHNNPTPDRVLYVAANLQPIILLPAPATLNLAAGSNPETLRLGPLIGIFANRFSKTVKPFGEQTSFFRKLRSAADGLNAFCFAFCPSDIDWENKVIRGSIPPLPHDERSGWQTLPLPFPDVIYDRGLFPKGDKRRIATETRMVLRKYPGVKLFNPAFFGKWKTHKLLSKHEVLHGHLPKTRLYTNPADIFELLGKHGIVYLKPSGGSSGRGIIRIAVSPAGYTVNFRESGQVKALQAAKGAELAPYLKEILKGRRYIVQQGLKLARINGCPFDIRVLMQRNRSGSWLRTGMAVRVASPGNFISNLHAGGHAEKISSVLPRVFPDLNLAGKAINEIRRVCALIASWVTAEGHPLFGEIAVDLGIDESCKVWIIELNAVPGRSVFRRIKSKEILAQAISRPIEFAYFISGFAPQSTK